MHPERSNLAGPGVEPRHGTHVPRVLVISALALFLAGCTSGFALRTVHSRMAEAYGDATNQQLLLNLARLSNYEPAYFIQLGAFNEEYNVTAGGALGSSSYVRNSEATPGTSGFQRALTVGGGPNMSITDNPTFNFVPLTGDMFSQLLLRPFPPETVSDFAKTGFHLDVLFRMMVQSIEIEAKASHPEKCNPPVGSTMKCDHKKLRDVIVNHPLDPSYPVFLELCYELNRAQRSALVQATAEAESKSDFTVVIYDPKDVLRAVKDGISIKPGADPNQYNFSLDGKNAFMLKAPEKIPPEEFPILSLLTSTKYKVTYHFRSFEGLMYAAAQEEGYYRTAFQNAKLIKDRGHTNYTVNISAAPESSGTTEMTGTVNMTVSCSGDKTRSLLGPAEYEVEIGPEDRNMPRALIYSVKNLRKATITAHPILTLTSYKKYPSRNGTTAEISYKRIRYVIGSDDNESDYKVTRLPSMTNRNVFSLISYLFGKAALEPNKLPIQQLIQVK